MSESSKEKLGQLFNRIKNDKKSLFIVIIGLVGMIMIAASEATEKTVTADKDKTETVSYEILNEQAELERIIGKITGTGKVSVMLTYEGTSENIYANNISEQKSGEENRREEEHIILDKGNTEDGLLIKSVYPHVIGVAVVCEGGGSATVKNEITQMLKALYNINSNNISISEMKG